jgi:SulP family sulfate permease
VRLRRVPVLDATALHTLVDVVHRSRLDGTLVLLAEAQAQPLATIRGSAAYEEIGEEQFCETLEAALARAEEEVEGRRLLGG